MNYSMEYVSQDMAMKVQGKLTWQRPGAAVDLLSIDGSAIAITLPQGVIVSEPRPEELLSRKKPGWRWVCDVEYTNTLSDLYESQGIKMGDRLRMSCDPFQLVSYRHVLQKLLILLALSKK